MEHTTRDGEPRILERCSYPLTAPGVVKRIYTDLAVIEIARDGLVVTELAPGVTFEEVKAKTGAAVRMA
jgi:3-oxoadipate CoA-transferase beta subunit